MTPTDGIGGRILSGVAWKAGSQLTLQVSRLAVALVLARLLAPHDWGLAAMVFVFTGFVVVFTDSALGTALIQRRQLEPGDRSTVFWLSAAIGVLLMLGGVAAAGPVASFYGEPEVRPLFAAMSVGFLVSALGSTHMALLTREMEFRRLELRQIAATLGGAAVGIGLAVGGAGAWAIVGQLIAEAVTSTLVVWAVTPWRPSLVLSTASVRRLGGFAGNVFGENVLYQAGKNLNALLIGRFLGPASVASYVLATNVILIPFSRLAAPLQQVFFPAFSRIADDRTRLGEIWLRATRVLALVAMPALVGLVVVADDFVEAVLGPAWVEATPVIRILAWVGIVQALQSLNGEVLLAVGRASTLLRFTVLWLAGTILAFAVGIHWGVTGVAVSYLVATLLIEPIKTALTLRAVSIAPMAYARSLAGVVQATALMAVVLVAAKGALQRSELPVGVRLVLLVVIGAGAYLIACRWRVPDLVDDIRMTVGRRLRGAARRQPLPRGVLEP